MPKPPAPSLTAFHASVTGHVQGVGFRWQAINEAQRIGGITGWVRNCEDGSVEVWAEGKKPALERFIAWLEAGPGYGRVDNVHYTWCEASGKLKSFGVRY
ncbi:MAG: acylphosphatase [Spirochaetaceae bacterium]|jgi:acylphosphatase|nr:acylphosphatase [Spirochaetaceae bacterium]